MKQTVCLAIFLLTTCGFTLNAQIFLPKKTYMHLVGRIDDTRDITLNLVKVYDSLYADLVYTEDNCTHTVLCGKVNPDGSFWMKYPFCDTGKIFRGSFISRQTLSGTYESVDGKELHPFVLAESYPAGSLPLLVYFSELTKNLVPTDLSPQADIRQCLIIPGESSNPVISDTLRNLMLRSFTEKKGPWREPEATLESIQNQFLEHYQSSNEPLYKTMPNAGCLNWTLLKFMHVIHNDNYILTYYVLHYAYTGGAHGLETQDFTVVHSSSGKVLTLADIFHPGSETKLTALLTAKMKRMLQLSLRDKLTEHGFFVEEVIPNMNFYVTANGIGFFYNHYEIAPYANGPTDIFLSFGDLKGLIRKDSPVSCMASHD